MRLPGDGIGGVVGYLDRDSATCGDVVQAHLAEEAAHASVPVRLAAYRIGWYRGAGARLVWRSGVAQVTGHPVPSGAAPPHLVSPQWPVTVSVPVGAGWPPGFYLLLPQGPRRTVVGRAIPLVVRDDGGTEPILFKASTLTWNAYDEWGGWSLYHGPTGSHDVQVANRARVVALHRPLTGSGYDQMTAMDLPVVHQIEQLAAEHDLDVAYTTDENVDAEPGQLLRHAEIVSGGHSEYWTAGMYDGLLAAADAGVHLVFLGATNLWWHARLEGGTPGDPVREVVYRVLAEDPVAATDPAAATVEWNSTPLNRDPATVLGQSHAGIGVRGGLQLLDPPAWYIAGTGLSERAALPGAVGNEADGFDAAARNPAHTQIFAAGVLTGAGAAVLVTNSYSTRPSGAAVFAAGSTDWACAPTGQCEDRSIPRATARYVQTMTANVLLALSAPRAGLTHPADATAPLTAAYLSTRLPAEAIGTYGGASTDEVAHRPHP